MLHFPKIVFHFVIFNGSQELAGGQPVVPKHHRVQRGPEQQVVQPGPFC